MATAARAIRCNLQTNAPPPERKKTAAPTTQVTVPAPNLKSKKILLQPRLCTLRSYGSDRAAVMKLKTRKHAGDETPPFFEVLSDYIESSRKSQDFETASGRFAMVVFAATVAAETVTGNSVFSKMDLQGIAEAGGVCAAAVAGAAAFAWFTSARKRVGRIFSSGCNTFIDSLIDQIVDGLFYENELDD